MIDVGYTLHGDDGETRYNGSPSMCPRSESWSCSTTSGGIRSLTSCGTSSGAGPADHHVTVTGCELAWHENIAKTQTEWRGHKTGQ